LAFLCLEKLLENGVLGNLLPLTQPSVQFTENETLKAQQKITSGLPVIGA
jgi:hypothetical protein